MKLKQNTKVVKHIRRLINSSPKVVGP